VNFSEAESYLYSLGNEVEAMKLGLENIRTLLAALGNPHEKYFKVQVAGTNGKGSVCAFLDSICRQSEIKTGLYTSPHLVSITERLKIDGVDVSEVEFARIALLVREKAEILLAEGKLTYRPTFFEQVTAIALVAFADAGVELAILETGLGGRLDATTAANSEIAAITHIALDHQEYLGDTIEEIAAEKAAIIGPYTKAAVIGEQDDLVLPILLERASSFGIIPLTVCEPFVFATGSSKHSRVAEFRTNRNYYWDSSLGLAGAHQIQNACIAVMVAETLRNRFRMAIDEENIWIGLENARHPGRLEYVGNFLLDGAHNIAGAQALAAYLDEFVEEPITMIFGAMKDKDVNGIAQILWPKAERLILTRPNNSRAMTAEELWEFVPKEFDREKVILTNSVEEVMQEASSANLILVTGSLYLVGEVKSLLIRKQI
jgi:folylpolyglutamate synthase/dihydrofolate synthase